MPTRTHHRAAAAAGVCTVVAIPALTACDSAEEPTPAATESSSQPTEQPTAAAPTEEPTPSSYRDQQIEAATDFVLDFYTTVDEVAQDGYENWKPRLFLFFTGSEELWQLHSGGYRQNAESRLSIEGSNEVYSIEATDWERASDDAAGFDTVTFDLCVDPREVVYLNEDGSENEEQTAGIPDHRFPTQIEDGPTRRGTRLVVDDLRG